MVQLSAGKVLLAPVLLAALLLQHTCAKVTHIQVTRLVSLVPGEDGVDWEGDDIRCRLEDDGTYGCSTSCVGTIGPLTYDTPNYCYVDWRPTCSGKWCAANVTVEAYTDKQPTKSNTRMVVSAHPVFHIKQLDVDYKMSRPFKVKWVFQIGTAVSVGEFPSEGSASPYRPLVTFLAAQHNQLIAAQTAMRWGCSSLVGAGATFSSPKVNCAEGGNVEANATVWGCPRLWEAENQGDYINVFDASDKDDAPASTRPMTDQYSSYIWSGEPGNVLSTLGAGRIQVWIKRDNHTYLDGETNTLVADYPAWPKAVKNIRIGYRTHPTSGDPVPIEKRRWNLSPRSNTYQDKDGDGWGEECDCDDEVNSAVNECDDK